MIIFKLLIILALLILAIYLSIRLIKRGLAKRYEPKARTPWSILSEGDDPTIEGDAK
jgi:hypothetical protein